MIVGTIQRDQPYEGGVTSKVLPGRNIKKDSHTSLKTLVYDVKISAKTTSEK
jgi:hypothetical protein